MYTCTEYCHNTYGLKLSEEKSFQRRGSLTANLPRRYNVALPPCYSRVGHPDSYSNEPVTSVTCGRVLFQFLHFLFHVTRYLLPHNILMMTLAVSTAGTLWLQHLSCEDVSSELNLSFLNPFSSKESFPYDCFTHNEIKSYYKRCVWRIRNTLFLESGMPSSGRNTCGPIKAHFYVCFTHLLLPLIVCS